MATPITGTFVDGLGAARAHTVVKFKPLSGATVLGSNISVPGIQQAKTNASGVVSLSLMPGDYEVWLGNEKQFQISVSDTVSTLNLVDITSESLVYVNTLIPLYSRLPRSIFSDFADVGTISNNVTTLSSKTLAANLFTANGDRLVARYVLDVDGTGSTKTFKTYIGGTLVSHSVKLNSASYNVCEITLEAVRVSSSVLRVCVSTSLHNSTTAFGDDFTNGEYTEVTSLNFASTLLLEMTGLADLASYSDNDIVLKFANGLFIPNV